MSIHVDTFNLPRMTDFEGGSNFNAVSGVVLTNANLVIEVLGEFALARVTISSATPVSWCHQSREAMTVMMKHPAMMPHLRSRCSLFGSN